MGQTYDWELEFDERQLKEIGFSIFYARDFAHGTDGHNAKIIIAKMASLLRQHEDRINGLISRLDVAEQARNG